MKFVGGTIFKGFPCNCRYNSIGQGESQKFEDGFDSKVSQHCIRRLAR